MLKFFVNVLLLGLISSDVVVMGCCEDCCKDKTKKLRHSSEEKESIGNSSIQEITNLVPETVNDIIPLIYDNEIDDNETVDDIIPLIYDNEIDDNETVDDNIPLIDDNEIGKFKGFSFDVITAKVTKIQGSPQIDVLNVYDSKEDIKKTVVNFIKWFRANKNYAGLKTRRLKFIDRSRIVEDSLGVMRHIFTQTKDSIISNERLFQSRVCGDTAYYDFVKGGEHY
ncbi:MAG: hypothetical protein II393_04245, partial [Cytophagales bacterium]|nr:hypothetical protein [Cytophagales bacterium]